MWQSLFCNVQAFFVCFLFKVNLPFLDIMLENRAETVVLNIVNNISDFLRKYPVEDMFN